jgi:hypothetical protein
MQITQFVIDIAVVYFASTLPTSLLVKRADLWTPPLAYSHVAFTRGLPTVGDCAGDLNAALYGCALLTFYLVLFINFYRRTYNAASAKKTANGYSNGKAIANGKTNGVSK